MVNLENNILELSRVLNHVANDKVLKSTLSRLLYLLGTCTILLGLIVDHMESGETNTIVSDEQCENEPEDERI